MEPGLKGLQSLIYKGRLGELNLCCLAKQQLMREGWMTNYRHRRGDATGPDHIPGMLSPAWPLPSATVGTMLPCRQGGPLLPLGTAGKQK